jgi:DNA-binding PadR family transcriptional regulator
MFSSKFLTEAHTKLSAQVPPLSRKILAEVDRHTLPVFETITVRYGDSSNVDIYFMQLAMGLEPESLRLVDVANRMPYCNPAQIQRDLDGVVARGWLMVIAEGVYAATEKGRQFYFDLCRKVDRAYTGLSVLPTSRLERLHSLLRGVVDLIETNSPLDYRPALALDGKLTGCGGSAIQRVCCKLAQILAYREDAYLNAWSEHQIAGYEWETFACIYKGRAHTIAQIASSLGANSYYSEKVYREALHQLAARGWIESSSEIFEPTEAGLQVLAQVARTMNHYFYAPWAALTQTALEDLHQLLAALASAIQSGSRGRRNSSVDAGGSYHWSSVQWAWDKIR